MNSRALFKKTFLTRLSLAIVVIIVCVALFELYPSPQAVNEHFYDLLAFWSAFHFLQAGGNPYDSIALFEFQKLTRPSLVEPLIMRYPPFSLGLLSPLISLDYLSSSRLWLFFNLTAVGLASILTVKFWSVKKQYIPCCMLLAFFFFPVWRSLESGQLGVVLWLAFSGVFFLESKNKHFAVGLASLFLLLKPHLFLLFVPPALLWTIKERAWRCVLSFVGGFTLLFLLTYFWFPSAYFDWVSSKDWGQNDPLATLATILRVLLLKLGYPLVSWPLWFFPLVGVIGVSAGLLFTKGDFSWKSKLPWLLPLSLAFSPYALPCDYALLAFLHVFFLKVIMENWNDVKVRNGALELIMLNVVFFVCYDYRTPTLHALYLLLVVVIWAFRFKGVDSKAPNATQESSP